MIVNMLYNEEGLLVSDVSSGKIAVLDNKLGIDIWTKKYQFENETFDEWLDRVSNCNEKVKELILEKKFLFGGRILSNRGLDKKGVKTTLSNCYVIAPPEDNIESIYDTASKLARTFSYGGKFYALPPYTVMYS